MEFQAMGELEYYVISENDGLFPATDQRGYHESAPYAKFNDFRTECMSYIAQAGGQISMGILKSVILRWTIRFMSRMK